MTMATRRKKVDVVIVGLGAAGGTATLPLARSGLDVLALEAGGRLTPRDFHPDEVRNDVRNFMGRTKANGEVPTLRATAAETAGPPQVKIVMVNAVGGSSIHWTGQAWRFVPWNFRERSETIRRYGAGAIPPGVALADWPVTYNEIAPFYDAVERTHGISGQAGNLRRGRDRRGNRFEGKRRPYPLPPLRRSGWTELMAGAARRLDWDPFPGPAGILSRDYRGRQACDYHGFCTYNGCHVSAKASTNVTTIPLAERRKNFNVLTRARVTRILTDRDGRARGVEFVRGGETFVQPADAVILSTYVYENNRLLMLSRSRAHPQGIGNRFDQLGKYYMAHSYLTVSGLFAGRELNLFSGTGAQFTAIDNWDADNFDHTGLGFIGGATLSSGMENKPIAQARNIPPTVQPWGSPYKAWLKANANSVGSAFAQVPCMPYEANMLDLDPTAKDRHGLPRIRITYQLGDNENRMGAFLKPKLEAWLKEAGATETWGGDTVFPIAVNSHAYGGTRMGSNPRSSVVNRWCQVHDVPNLFVLGGSTFPSTTSKNPTETIMALAWRSADHLARNWNRITR
jgi:gluconate 2-dehydrogenase alpha chain